MINNTSLFGLDSEQKYSFLQVVEYLAAARATDEDVFPSIPASLLSGFDISQSRSLVKYFKDVWLSVPDPTNARIEASGLAEGCSLLDKKTLKALAPSIASYIEARAPSFTVNDWDPTLLFANGEKGVIYDPSNRSSVYTDYAGTTTLAMAENDLIANMHDLSPNNLSASRFNTSLRPKLVYLSGSYRRGIDYDSVDDALATTFPDALGSNCTIARAQAGVGAVITTGQTINAGVMNSTNDNCGLVILDRALTASEEASLRIWLRERAGVEDEYSVPYGDDPDEILDVYHSSGNPDGPIIFMVHGGGWRNGSKASPNVTKNKLLNWLPQGFTFVSINYPMGADVTPVEECESTAKALAWVQRNAGSWGCNRRNIITMGHSAGGHLVALLASSKDIQRNAGVRPWKGTVVIDGAAFDVPAIMRRDGHLSLYDDAWGTDEELWVAGSPTFTLTVAPSPMLLITSTDSNPGEADANVGPFADAVNALGGSATILHTDLDHSGTNTELGAPGAYTDTVEDFINSCLA